MAIFINLLRANNPKLSFCFTVSNLGCEAQQVWLLARHGTRYPLTKDYQRLAATLPLIAQEVVFNHKEGHRGKLIGSYCQLN